MSNEKKFLTEDELAQLKSFKAQQSNITFALGEVQLRKQALLEAHKNVVAAEQDLVNKLSIKYGDGNLDLNTGEIVSREPGEQN